ncbi:MAG TPA: tetratricopeptide repeat protein [Firmicutes bacterium]|nr:tetratricopeptide repeat protein [Bacillota bacterium]
MGKNDKLLKRVDKICRAGDYTDAMYKLQDALLQYPDDGDLLWKLVEVYSFQKDDENAVKTLSKIVKYKIKAPDYVIGYIKQDFRQAFPYSKAADLFLFDLYIQRKEYKNAALVLRVTKVEELQKLERELSEKMDKLLKVSGEEGVFKKNFDLLCSLVIVRVLLKKEEEAFTPVQRVLENGIKDLLKKMKTLLEEISGLDSVNPFPFYYAGLTELALGETEAATGHLLSAVKIRHALAPAALERLEPFIGSVEQTPQGLKSLADIYYYGENYEKSVFYITRLAENEKDPEKLSFLEEYLTDIYLKTGPRTPILLAQCRFQMALGQYDEAFRKLTQIKDFSSPDIEPLLKELLDKVADKSTAYKLLGDMKLNEGQLEEAVKAYSEVFRIDKGYADYLSEKLKNADLSQSLPGIHLMADLSLYRGDLKSAFRYYKELMDRYPDETEQAIQGIEKVVEGSKKSVKIRTLLLGIYIDKKMGDKALRLIGDIIKLDYHAVQDIYRSIIHLAETVPGAAEKLVQLITIILSKDPANLYAIFASAHLYALMNDPAKTTEAIKKIMVSGNQELIEGVTGICDSLLENNPHDRELQWSIVNILFDAGRFDQITEQLYTLYLNNQGEGGNILNLLAETVRRGYVDNSLVEIYYKIAMEQNLFNEMDLFIKEALTVNGEIPWIYIALARLSFNREDMTTVIKSFQRLLKYGEMEHFYMVRDITDDIRKIVKPNPGLYYILGLIYRRIGEHDVMLDLFEKVAGKDEHTDTLIMEEIRAVIEEKPQEFRFRILAGKMEYLKGNHKEAVSFFNQAVKINRESAANLVTYYEEMSRDHIDDQFYLLELIKNYLECDLYDEAVMFLKEITVQEEYFLKYMQVLRLMTEYYPEDSFAYTKLGDYFWESGKHEEAVPHYVRAMELGDSGYQEEIIDKIRKDLDHISTGVVWRLFIDLALELGRTDEAFSSLDDALERLSREDLDELKERLAKTDDEGQNIKTTRIMTRLLLKLGEKDEAFAYMKGHLKLLLYHPQTAVELFDSLLEKTGYDNRIFTYYLSYLYQSDQVDKIEEVLSHLDKTNAEPRQKAKYAIMCGDIKKRKGKAAEARDYYHRALEFSGSVKEQMALFEEVKRINDEAWISYLEKSREPSDKLALIDILINRGDYDRAYGLLMEPGRPEDEKLRLFLLLNYYMKKRDYMSYITTAGKITFDSLSLGEPEIKIIRNLVKAFRELHLFQKALYYLHYLKGFVEDDEYTAIRNTIEQEKQQFSQSETGHYLTK